MIIEKSIFISLVFEYESKNNLKNITVIEKILILKNKKSVEQNENKSN